MTYLLAGLQRGLQQRRHAPAGVPQLPQLVRFWLLPVQAIEAPKQQHEGVASRAADDVGPQVTPISRRLHA